MGDVGSNHYYSQQVPMLVSSRGFHSIASDSMLGLVLVTSWMRLIGLIRKAHCMSGVGKSWVDDIPYTQRDGTCGSLGLTVGTGV